MYDSKVAKRVYVKRPKKVSRMYVVQMSIIFVFIFVSTLISVLLPFYINYQPLLKP